MKLRDWFHQHLVEDILPHWLEAAVCENGFFYPSLNRRWERIPPVMGTLVSQSRLLYNFSLGWNITKNSTYREVVGSGTEFLLQHFTDSKNGGLFWSVDAQGEVIDPRKDAYGHAFAIFGLAHAAKTLESKDLGIEAGRILLLMREQFRDIHGGIVPALNPEMTIPTGDPRSQNPIMHLFEAHLAMLECLGPDEDISTSAEEFARFVHHKLGHPQLGRLPEMYDKAWQELSHEQGGRIDLGHAVEWAFLLSRGQQLGLSDEWVGVGTRLLDRVLEVGAAPEGGIYSNESPEGGLLGYDLGYWQQCELLRALMHYATVRQRADLQLRFMHHFNFVKHHFIDTEFGGWFSTPMVDSAPPADDSKGSIWKLDYHVCGLCAEVLRILD